MSYRKVKGAFPNILKKPTFKSWQSSIKLNVRPGDISWVGFSAELASFGFVLTLFDYFKSFQIISDPWFSSEFYRVQTISDNDRQRQRDHFAALKAYCPNLLLKYAWDCMSMHYKSAWLCMSLDEKISTNSVFYWILWTSHTHSIILHPTPARSKCRLVPIHGLSANNANLLEYVRICQIHGLLAHPLISQNISSFLIYLIFLEINWPLAYKVHKKPELTFGPICQKWKSSGW